jgi:hypothetical protein
MKLPLDLTPYPRDPRSQPASGRLPDGGYAYVRDRTGTVYVVPDAPHIHPRVLGNAEPAFYAGDLTVRGGRVIDLTNLSGTFQFDDPDGLLSVADQLIQQGMLLEPGAVRLFPSDGSMPLVLR